MNEAIHSTAVCDKVLRRGWGLSQLTSCEQAGSSLQVAHTPTFTPVGNLESQIKPICIALWEEATQPTKCGNSIYLTYSCQRERLKGYVWFICFLHKQFHQFKSTVRTNDVLLHITINCYINKKKNKKHNFSKDRF